MSISLTTLAAVSAFMLAAPSVACDEETGGTYTVKLGSGGPGQAQVIFIGEDGDAKTIDLTGPGRTGKVRFGARMCPHCGSKTTAKRRAFTFKAPTMKGHAFGVPRSPHAAGDDHMVWVMPGHGDEFAFAPDVEVIRKKARRQADEIRRKVRKWVGDGGGNVFEFETDSDEDGNVFVWKGGAGDGNVFFAPGDEKGNVFFGPGDKKGDVKFFGPGSPGKKHRIEIRTGDGDTEVIDLDEIMERVGKELEGLDFDFDFDVDVEDAEMPERHGHGFRGKVIIEKDGDRKVIELGPGSGPGMFRWHGEDEHDGGGTYETWIEAKDEDEEEEENEFIQFLPLRGHDHDHDHDHAHDHDHDHAHDHDHDHAHDHDGHDDHASTKARNLEKRLAELQERINRVEELIEKTLRRLDR